MKGKDWLNSLKDEWATTSIDWEAVDDLLNIIEERDFYKQAFIHKYNDSKEEICISEGFSHKE